jgi:hypothetical protein
MAVVSHTHAARRRSPTAPTGRCPGEAADAESCATLQTPSAISSPCRYIAARPCNSRQLLIMALRVSVIQYRLQTPPFLTPHWQEVQSDHWKQVPTSFMQNSTRVQNVTHACSGSCHPSKPWGTTQYTPKKRGKRWGRKDKWTDALCVGDRTNYSSETAAWYRSTPKRCSWRISCLSEPFPP